MKIVIAEKEFFQCCMTDVAKLQNVRLLFPNKKRLAWPVPVWSKYLVFTVSVCRSRNIEAGHYHIRSAIQPPAPPPFPIQIICEDWSSKHTSWHLQVLVQETLDHLRIENREERWHTHKLGRACLYYTYMHSQAALMDYTFYLIDFT